jgi:ABC-type bacteriocin/lantibiotic exporter with double-glycine peptidase domain
VYAQWSEHYRKQLFYTYRKPFFLKYNGDIMAALTTLATVVLLWQAMRSGLTSGDYMTFTSAYALIVTAVAGLTDIMQNMFLVRALCQNVAPLLEKGDQARRTTEYVHRLKGQIRAENIHFAYPGDPRGCLDGVDMHIMPGEKIAIVGESGCGKSTFLKILMGMEKPDDGNVFYDGESMTGLNTKSLRRCIGSVFQFSRLFTGTIFENVCLGNGGHPDEDKVWAALDFVGLGDYVRDLPLKLDTEISESNSCGFSGGQRQMLLLARAVLNHPSVLILDEATSALDNMSQEHVLRNIRGMRATVIMVAHRLSTVAGFDRIIMFANGKIVEEGSYQALMELDGAFATLVRKQLIQKSN